MNFEINWRLKIDDQVYKDLVKFPKDYQSKILDVIENFPANPYAGDINKIRGEKFMWRRRVGRYRVFYEIKPIERLIHVQWVEFRKSNTY